MDFISNVSYTLGVFFSYKNYKYTLANQPLRHDYDLNLQSILTSYFDYSDTWLVILVLASIVFVITLLTVIFLRKRITVAIALIKEGSKAVASNMSTLIFPVFPWLVQILVIVYAVYVMTLLSSIGTPEYKVNDYRSKEDKQINKAFDCRCNNEVNYTVGAVCTTEEFNRNCKSLLNPENFCIDKACIIIGLKKSDLVQFFQGLNVFGFFWMIFFITAFSEMVLAGVFATWYWTKNTKNRPFFSLTESIARTIRFHLGTVAFGALIITICRIIRLILEYCEQKIQKYANYAVFRAILCLCKCCFWCLENFMKFVNKNAYIMTAIHGSSFCASARNSFNLLMRNVLRALALDKVLFISISIFQIKFHVYFRYQHSSSSYRKRSFLWE